LQGYGFFGYFCFFWLINASFLGVYSNTVEIAGPL